MIIRKGGTIRFKNNDWVVAQRAVRFKRENVVQEGPNLITFVAPHPEYPTQIPAVEITGFKAQVQPS
jgi:hypothetical protein